jgi:hypothetical protein
MLSSPPSSASTRPPANQKQYCVIEATRGLSRSQRTCLRASFLYSIGVQHTAYTVVHQGNQASTYIRVLVGLCLVPYIKAELPRCRSERAKSYINIYSLIPPYSLGNPISRLSGSRNGCLLVLGPNYDRIVRRGMTSHSIYSRRYGVYFVVGNY